MLPTLVSTERVVLAIDDEPYNLDVIEGYLEDHGYRILMAEDGESGLKMLEEHMDEIEIILMDRMMPGMDGLEVTKKIKENENAAHIPIIMQTAAADKAQIVEGIQAGVYYYLTKPYDGDMLLAAVNAAYADLKRYLSLAEKTNNAKTVLGYVTRSEFAIETLEQAELLTSHLASHYPEPMRVMSGISEMLVNAIEHGNLGVSYEMKTELIQAGKWQEELVCRMELPENKGKHVEVVLERTTDAIILTIKDCGKGFNWKNFLDIGLDRMSETHGRGIALANMISFDEITYTDPGNVVICKNLLTS